MTTKIETTPVALSMRLADAREAYSIIKPAIATRAMVPALYHVSLDATREGVTFAATDLGMAITTKTIGMVESPGQCLLPAKQFSIFMDSIANKEAALFIEAEQGERCRITLRCSGHRMTIPTISAEEFPPIAASGDSPQAIFDSQEFAAAIRRVVFAAATQDFRPVLTGVFMALEAGNLRLAAADGYQLAETILKNQRATDDKFAIVVPGQAAHALGSLAAAGGTSSLEVVGTDRLIATIGDTILATRLIDGVYPNYRQLLLTDYKTTIIVDKSLLREAVGVNRILADNQASILKLTMEQDVAGDKLVVASTGDDTGDSASRIPIEHDGDPDAQIAVNCRYLAEALAVVDGQKANLSIRDAASPLIIKDDNTPEWFTLIVAMHLRQ